jgi:hypothetical protein
VNVRKLACYEMIEGSLVKDSFDIHAVEGATNLEHFQEPGCKSVKSYKSPELKSCSDCTSACNTSSSNQDQEGNSIISQLSREGTNTLVDRTLWNYGCDSNSMSSSSLMGQSFEGDNMRQLSKKKRSYQLSSRARSNEFDRKPWNFGYRRDCRSASNSKTITQFSDSAEYSKRRSTSELTRRATVTEFNRKPWNYGDWRDRRSVANFTQLKRSFDSEGNFQRHCQERRRSSMVTRRATVAEFDRKPWNYGKGGSKYKKLLKYFAKKKSVN